MVLPKPPATKVKKSDKRVKDAAKPFEGQTYTDVLNKMWRLGYPVENLIRSLAQTQDGTNDVTDIITRLVNSGVDINDFVKASMVEIEPNLALPFKFRDPTSPLLPGAEVVHSNPSPSTHARQAQPLINPGRISNEKLPGQTPTVPAQGGGGVGGGNQTVKAPPLEIAKPKTDQEIREFVARKYGGYASLIDDPAFADIRKVLYDAAEGEWDPAQVEAQIKSTPWWQGRGEKAAEWDVLVKSHDSEATARLNRTVESMSQLAKRLGITIDPGRMMVLATELHRSGDSDNGAKIQSMVASEAIYKEDYTGDIGVYETTIKSAGRDFLMNVSDEEAFGMAKRIAMGELSVDAVPEHFRSLAKGAMPTFAAQIDQGLTPRQLLNQHTQQIANLLEIDPETIDYIKDPRFNSVISYAGEKGELRPMTLTETSKHIRGLEDYWKTGNAGKEVGSMIQTLGRSFGKIA